LDREKIGRYLQWVDNNFGFPSVIKKTRVTHIPHFGSLFSYLIPRGILELYRESLP